MAKGEIVKRVILTPSSDSEGEHSMTHSSL